MTSYGGATSVSSGPAWASSYRSARKGRTSATTVKLPSVSAIAELAEERVVEGIYAVARKQRLRTRGGSPYLALELVDPSGRIDARVWHDVELLDARFAEGDAIRVLGRVEKFRDRLQVDVRTLEAAADADPAELAPALRRDPDELDGFLDFLAAEIAHPGLAAVVGSILRDDSLRRAFRR